MLAACRWGSVDNWAVMSTGLSGEPGGQSALSRACTSAEGVGSVRPASAAASAICAPIPPEIVTTPSRGPLSKLGVASAAAATSRRSEEHTSELQSLMRNSYAVFCLKKKKKQTTQQP